MPINHDLNLVSKHLTDTRAALNQLRVVGDHLADSCRSILAGLNVAMQIIQAHEERLNELEQRLIPLIQ